MSYNKLAAAKAGGATVGTVVGGTAATWAVINHTALFFGGIALLGATAVALFFIGVLFSKFYIRFDPAANATAKAKKKKIEHDYRARNSRYGECPNRRDCEYGCV